MLCRLPSNGHDGDSATGRLAQEGAKEQGEESMKGPLAQSLLNAEQEPDGSNS